MHGVIKRRDNKSLVNIPGIKICENLQQVA